MTVLDTDFIIDLMRGDEGATARLDALLEGYQPLAVSAMTVMELHHGVSRVKAAERERARITRALRGAPRTR